MTNPILLLDRTELPFEETLDLEGTILQPEIIRFADEWRENYGI